MFRLRFCRKRASPNWDSRRRKQANMRGTGAGERIFEIQIDCCLACWIRLQTLSQKSSGGFNSSDTRILSKRERTRRDPGDLSSPLRTPGCLAPVRNGCITEEEYRFLPCQESSEFVCAHLSVVEGRPVPLLARWSTPDLYELIAQSQLRQNV